MPRDILEYPVGCPYRPYDYIFPVLPLFFLLPYEAQVEWHKLLVWDCRKRLAEHHPNYGPLHFMPHWMPTIEERMGDDHDPRDEHEFPYIRGLSLPPEVFPVFYEWPELSDKQKRAYSKLVDHQELPLGQYRQHPKYGPLHRFTPHDYIGCEPPEATMFNNWRTAKSPMQKVCTEFRHKMLAEGGVQ